MSFSFDTFADIKLFVGKHTTWRNPYFGGLYGLHTNIQIHNMAISNSSDF